MTRTRLQPARSYIASQTPPTGGEPGSTWVNPTDGRLWAYRSDGTPVELLTGESPPPPPDPNPDPPDPTDPPPDPDPDPPPDPDPDPDPPPDPPPEPSDPTDPTGIEWLGMWTNESDHKATEDWLGKPIKWVTAKTAFETGGFGQASGPQQIAKLEWFATNSPHTRLSQICDIYPIGGDKNPRMDEIAAGQWDNELIKLAQMYVDAGQPDIALRLWHEPDVKRFKSTWHPDNMRPAWRRVWEVMMSVNNKFQWQYSLNGPAGDGGNHPDGGKLIDVYYPGAKYVDDVSMSLYDRQGSTPDASWNKARSKVDYTWAWANARGHKFSVAEWGLWNPNGNGQECGQHPNGQGDNPDFLTRSRDWYTAIPANKRSHMMYFGGLGRMPCTNLNQFSNSKTRFKNLFGG